jgi:hypothetical protein
MNTNTNTVSDQTQTDTTTETSATDEIKSLLSVLEQESIEPAQEFGESMAFYGNDDYALTKARIVPNMSPLSSDSQKWVYLHQGTAGLSVTLKTLKELIVWAETKQETK